MVQLQSGFSESKLAAENEICLTVWEEFNIFSIN